MAESRIPRPRTAASAGGANGAATPETRKQRYAPRQTPERSTPSGSSTGGRSGGRLRGAKPKPKLADLEEGWVGADVPLKDETADLPFAGGAFHSSHKYLHV